MTKHQQTLERPCKKCLAKNVKKRKEKPLLGPFGADNMLCFSLERLKATVQLVHQF